MSKYNQKNYNTVAIHPNIRYNIPSGNNWTNPLLFVMNAVHLIAAKTVPTNVISSMKVNALTIMF